MLEEMLPQGLIYHCLDRNSGLLPRLSKALSLPCSLQRQKESLSIRDNVLFELGLFIGKLSRDRVFFIIPEKTDLHIPTDLLGVTPGKYDPNREDKSFQAATGPNVIKYVIKLSVSAF